jgi:hypothetical protein
MEAVLEKASGGGKDEINAAKSKLFRRNCLRQSISCAFLDLEEVPHSIINAR